MTDFDRQRRPSEARVPTRPIRNAAVLVLGASGVIGSAVSRALLADGVHVIAQGRNRARLALLQVFGASSVEGDIRRPETRQAMRRVASDAIAVISFLPPQPGVIRSAASVMRDMPGTYRIHLSSSAVYERSRDQYDVTERETGLSGLNTCPFRSAERVFERETQGCVTLIRPARLFGITELGAPILRRARGGPLPLVRDKDVETSVLSLDTLSDALIHLLGTPSAGHMAGPFNLAEAKPVSVRYLVGKMTASHGVQVSWRPVSRFGLRAGETARSLCSVLDRSGPDPVNVAQLLGWSLTLDGSAFRRETGWVPKPAGRIAGLSEAGGAF